MMMPSQVIQPLEIPTAHSGEHERKGTKYLRIVMKIVLNSQSPWEDVEGPGGPQPTLWEPLSRSFSSKHRLTSPFGWNLHPRPSAPASSSSPFLTSSGLRPPAQQLSVVSSTLQSTPTLPWGLCCSLHNSACLEGPRRPFPAAPQLIQQPWAAELLLQAHRASPQPEPGTRRQLGFKSWLCASPALFTFFSLE